MKSILLICDQSRIDTPLRRSMAHLVRSCKVEILPSGFQALEELASCAFDIIIIDAHLSDIDGLELVESITYLDPDVPVVVMIDTFHKMMWGLVRRLDAHPILRPFKPVTFLRLIDTLLHQHLERYRELARTLELVLEHTQEQAKADAVFLMDGDGQILVTAVATPGATTTLKEQADLAINTIIREDDAIEASLPSPTEHTLLACTVTDNLHLVLRPSYASPLPDLWQTIDAAALEIREALETHTASGELLISSADVLPAETLNRYVIPRQPQSNVVPEPEPAPVNWQLIPDTTSTLLDRLHQFC